jgi:hypothetical protein
MRERGVYGTFRRKERLQARAIARAAEPRIFVVRKFCNARAHLALGCLHLYVPTWAGFRISL